MSMLRTAMFPIERRNGRSKAAESGVNEPAAIARKAAEPNGTPPSRPTSVPDNSRLWGFVRELQLEDVLKGDGDKNATLMSTDTTLWWDDVRHRFLIATDEKVIDDLSPLQFVQFVRELRDITNRILFKIERRPDGSAGRTHRVWG
jgi:hypothetical protein